MATVSNGLSSPGIGSGLDVNGLVSKLMAVEQQPLTVLQTKQASYQAKLSALGNVQSAIASLQTAVAGLTVSSTFTKQSATASDSSVLSASTTSYAAAGSYNVSVSTLAQAQTLNSAGNASTSAAIGSVGDTLTFQFGTYGAGTPAASFTANPEQGALTITLDAGQNNLAGIRDAINAANGGVTASIINDGSGTPYHLVITGANTGAANGLKISTSAGLSQFAFDPEASGNPMSQPVGAQAQDATLTVNGIAITSASNAVTDAIHGVTLNLLKGGDATSTLTVARDTSGTPTAIQNFVTAYNAATKAIKDVSSFDASTNTGGVLLGDATIRTIQNQLRNVLNTPINSSVGGLSSLSGIGVSFQIDGTLALDSAKLQTVMNDPTKDISTLFAAVGKATDSLVTVSASGASTKPGSYAVNVTQIATQGSASGNLTITNPTVIATGSNDVLDVTVDGIGTTVTLRAGSYTPTQLAAEIQSEINSRTAISSLGSSVNVTLSGGMLSLTSNRYGSASNVSITGGTAAAATGTTTDTAGLDTAGTIGGVAATGSGQTLTGTGNAVGLMLTIEGGATGARGTVNFSQGYAFQLSAVATSLLNPTTGLFAASTSGINASIADISKRTDAVNVHLTALEAQYRAQFSALDTLISSMNTTASFLTQQLTALQNNPITIK